jgi:hypothetical protein
MKIVQSDTALASAERKYSGARHTPARLSGFPIVPQPPRSPVAAMIFTRIPGGGPPGHVHAEPTRGISIPHAPPTSRPPPPHAITSSRRGPVSHMVDAQACGSSPGETHRPVWLRRSGASCTMATRTQRRAARRCPPHRAHHGDRLGGPRSPRGMSLTQGVEVGACFVRTAANACHSPTSRSVRTAAPPSASHPAPGQRPAQPPHPRIRPIRPRAPPARARQTAHPASRPLHTNPGPAATRPSRQTLRHSAPRRAHPCCRPASPGPPGPRPSPRRRPPDTPQHLLRPMLAPHRPLVSPALGSTSRPPCPPLVGAARPPGSRRPPVAHPRLDHPATHRPHVAASVSSSASSSPSCWSAASARAD